MNINIPTISQIPALRQLWQQAFGDSDAFLDSFFSVAFSPDRCRCLMVDDRLVSMLYWFDAAWEDKKLAYLYAVATDKAYQGQGFCRRLMEDTHTYLNSIGYAGAVLVPGSASLFAFYERLGYRAFGPVNRFSCAPGDLPVHLNECSTTEYAALRRQYLPENSILQEGVTLDFLATQTKFYRGDDFLLCGHAENRELYVQEFLGNPEAAPGILKAFAAQTGQFRTPGPGTPLAMYHPFSPTDALPAYLGLPLD